MPRKSRRAANQTSSSQIDPGADRGREGEPDLGVAVHQQDLQRDVDRHRRRTAPSPASPCRRATGTSPSRCASARTATARSHRPSASMPAACASAAVKAPRLNSARMINSGTIRNATRHGTDSSSVNSMARFCEWRAPASSPAVIRRAISGSSTVPAAMPITPIGKLVQPVGVVERRQRAGGEEAGDDGVGEQRDLGAGRADGRRPEPLEEQHAPRRRAAASANRGSTPWRAASPADQQEFQEAGEQHAPGRGVAGGRERTPPAPAPSSSTG